MGTGVAVSTGDLITAAKMNLKLEDARDMSDLGITDGGGTFEVILDVSETNTADRILTIAVNNAARTIDLSGNLTLAAALTTATAAITLTGTAGGSSVTVPASGTLATLTGAETFTNKTLTTPTINGAALSGTFSGTPTLSGATVTLTGGTLNLTAGAGYTIGTTDNFAITVKTNAVDKFVFTTTLGQFTVKQTTADVTLAFSDPGAARTITFADPGGNDSVVYLAATQTFTNKTLTSPTINTPSIAGGALSGTFTGAITFSGATISFTGGAIALTGGAAYVLRTTDAFNLKLGANNADRFQIGSTIGQLVVNQTTANVTLAFSDPGAARTITFPDPGGADSVCYLAATQTMSGKTLTLAGSPLNFTAGAAFTLGTTDNNTLTVKTNAVDKFVFTVTLGQFTVKQTTADVTLAFSNPGAARTITFPDPGGADSVCYLAATQTMSGKTLTLAGSPLNFTAGAAFTLGTTDNNTVTVKTNAVDKFVFTVTLGQFAVKQATADVTLAFSDPGAARTITFPDPGGADSVCYLAATQTMSGKTLTLAGSPLNFTAGAAFTFGTTDNNTVTVKTNAVDKFSFTTTLGQFTVNQTTANITLAFSDPGAARTITFADPGGADSVAYLAATQTLSGKTLSLAGDLTFASALDMVVQAATAAALETNDGTTKVYALDTRIAADNVTHHSFDATNSSYASGAGSTNILVGLQAHTVNLTGGVGVTAMNGLQLYITAATLTAGVATTVTTASSLYVTPVTAGANITITNSYMVNTSVAGCFLTAAGVWTDASSRQNKQAIKELNISRIPSLLDGLRVVSYRRREPTDGGFERFGVVAEEAPNFLAEPQHRGIAAQYMAGFALAALKWLKAERDKLEDRISQLERQLATA